MPTDHAITNVGLPNYNVVKSNYKSYLIALVDGKKVCKFITINQPEFVAGFIQVKGFFSEATEEDIVKNYSSITQATNNEKIVEIYFPNHRILNIRSLIYKKS